MTQTGILKRRISRSLAPLLLAAALATPAAVGVAGTIVGSVRAEGKDGAAQEAGSAQYQSRKFKFVERVDYTAMRDFVVFIDQAPVRKAEPPSKPLRIVTQKDATFSPHVLPVLAGTTVEWPNEDQIYHNVFSFSESKKFDLDLYKAPTVKVVVFDKPGRVDVFCSIHSRMHCIVLVLENPFFAATDGKGAFKIDHVPAGKYPLRAWHERLPSEAREVAVPEDGVVRMDFVLGIKNLPKY